MPDERRMVQPFMNDPFLIDNKKFDMRCYVLVTSISPLRAYMYGEGLARFAASNYSHNATNGGRRDQYLTNTSVGKLLAALSKLTWTFAKLKQWFGTHGHDPDAIFASIHRAAASVLVLSEPRFREHFAANLEGHSCTGCYQLLGIDVIFNGKLEPKVIEVNGLPSMQLSHNQVRGGTVLSSCRDRAVTVPHLCCDCAVNVTVLCCAASMPRL